MHSRFYGGHEKWNLGHTGKFSLLFSKEYSSNVAFDVDNDSIVVAEYIFHFDLKRESRILVVFCQLEAGKSLEWLKMWHSICILDFNNILKMYHYHLQIYALRLLTLRYSPSHLHKFTGGKISRPNLNPMEETIEGALKGF